MLANSADPDQTPHNQGGVGSGSPLLFARNLNKKEKQQKQDPNSGYELVQKMKMGSSLRHVWVNIKCENEYFFFLGGGAQFHETLRTILIMNTI